MNEWSPTTRQQLSSWTPCFHTNIRRTIEVWTLIGGLQGRAFDAFDIAQIFIYRLEDVLFAYGNFSASLCCKFIVRLLWSKFENLSMYHLKVWTNISSCDRTQTRSPDFQFATNAKNAKYAKVDREEREERDRRESKREEREERESWLARKLISRSKFLILFVCR